MVVRIFLFLCRAAPLKRLLWRNWYQLLAGYRTSDWTFMNYGYRESGDTQPLPLNAQDESDRSCIQLYHRVASLADLRGMRVLEVGSGRGGGASFVQRYHDPLAVTGLDSSAKAVDFSRRRHAVPGLSFQEGASEALPFTDESFDVVLNVESSHCYGSMAAFLSEVYRVLRPGGVFLYADLRERENLDAWRGELYGAGMTVRLETDITANVLEALDHDHDRKSELIERLIPRALQASFRDFAGLRGSKVYEGFRNGTLTYRMFQLGKTPVQG